MDEDLRLAEEIYYKVLDEQGFSDDYFDDLNKILKVFKQRINNTNTKIRYDFKDFDNLIDQVVKDGRKNIDLSLMPDRDSKQEFILWLAGVINIISYRDEPVLFPKKRVNKKKNINRPGNNGEEIMKYLKYHTAKHSDQD